MYAKRKKTSIKSKLKNETFMKHQQLSYKEVFSQGSWKMEYVTQV